MKIVNDLYEKGGGVCYQATLITEGIDDEELLSAVVDFIINKDTAELKDFVQRKKGA